MLDAKLIEEKPQLLKKTLEARGMKELLKDAELFVKLRKEWRSLKAELDKLRHERNKISLAINEAIKSGKKQEAEKKKNAARKISDAVKRAEDRIAEIEEKLKSLELEFPNVVSELPAKDKVIAEYGKVKKAKKEKWMKSFEELCLQHNLIDFESAAQMSGAGFYILRGNGAKLARALINFFLDLHKKQGYEELSVPLLVTERAMINSGQLPKFREGMFITQEELYLIPTSEVSLLNLYADKILIEKSLPKNVTAYSPCFRIEKGATKGFFRVRQFDKVELFKFTKQEESFAEHEKMLKDVIATAKALEIPFRVKLLSATEIGFASARTYDIEAFAPASNEWLEISSVSNCTDFQARRARIRYLSKGEKKLAHTLNGSGLALPRTIIAIIENNQQKDGSIKIPKVLQKYFGAKNIKEK